MGWRRRLPRVATARAGEPIRRAPRTRAARQPGAQQGQAVSPRRHASLAGAAANEAAQQRVEELARPRAHCAIVFPGGVLGDLQPRRVVVEAERLYLHTGLGEGLDRRFLGLALPRLEVDVGDGGGILERPPLLLAQAIPGRL